MNRRDLLTSFFAGAGLAVVGLSPEQGRAQRAGTRPIASAATNTARGLVIARVYPGPNRRSFIVMTRNQRGDIWRRVSVPALPSDIEIGTLRDEPLSIQVRPQGGQLLQFEIQLTSAGEHLNFTLRGEGTDGSGSVTPEEPPSTASALGFFGALVAIVAMLCGLAALAMLTGTPLSVRMRVRGAQLEIDVNGGSDVVPDNGGSGFMHDEICDTMPPMNC